MNQRDAPGCATRSVDPPSPPGSGGLGRVSGGAEPRRATGRSAPTPEGGAELIPFPAGGRGAHVAKGSERPPSPTSLLFVCRTHAVLSPMAEGLARSAYKRLDVRVRSAGLTVGPIDYRAVAVLAEIGIDIAETPATSVRDLDVNAFDIVVSLGIHKLGLERHQMALAWDVAEFDRMVEPTALSSLRDVRDALSARVHALGAVLATANRA